MARCAFHRRIPFLLCPAKFHKHKCLIFDHLGQVASQEKCLKPCLLRVRPQRTAANSLWLLLAVHPLAWAGNKRVCVAQWASILDATPGIEICTKEGLLPPPMVGPVASSQTTLHLPSSHELSSYSVLRAQRASRNKRQEIYRELPTPLALFDAREPLLADPIFLKGSDSSAIWLDP